MKKPFWSQLRQGIKLKHILLGLCLVSFAIGFAEVGPTELWELAKPVGAVLFILFYIVMMLDKPVSLYDKEHAERIAAADKKSTDSKPAVKKDVSGDAKAHSDLTTSTAH